SPLPTLVRLVTAFEPIAARDSLVLTALDEAIADLSRRLGADRSHWSWGALHRATFRHPVAAAFDLGDVPRGGDANTVNATAGEGYEQRWGASYRQILDLADWDRSVATSVPGQSGQPGSPTTTTCCRFGRKASISRSSTPARGSSAKRLTGWCCARRRGEGSPAAGPSLDHQMAGAPLRRRAEGGHEHLDLRRLRVGGPAIGADVRRAARATPKGGAV